MPEQTNKEIESDQPRIEEQWVRDVREALDPCNINEWNEARHTLRQLHQPEVDTQSHR